MKLLLATINPHVHNGTEDLSLQLKQTAPLVKGVALVAGQLYLEASGGAGGYTYSATGLPAGLSLNTATGAITGTPTTIGHSIVTATVADSATNSFTTTFSIDVLSRLVGVNVTPPSEVEAGVYASYQFSVSGNTGAVTWAVTSGSLTGMGTLSSGGALSLHIPADNQATANYGVTATDSTTGDTAFFLCKTKFWLTLDNYGGAAQSYEAITGVPLSIPYIGMAGGKPPFSYAPRTVGSVTNGTITVAY